MRMNAKLRRSNLFLPSRAAAVRKFLGHLRLILTGCGLVVGCGTVTALAQSQDQVKIQSRHTAGEQAGFDPATFVSIFEDTKAGAHIEVYRPGSSNAVGTHLGVDAESSVVVVPDGGRLQNSNISLNKLFMSAVLTSGDKQQKLEVVGYSEVGKDQSTAAAQRGMAFQTIDNIQNMILNMAYTAVDILKTTYGIDEQKRVLDPEVQKAIHSETIDAALRQRAMDRFALYKPEIQAIGSFFANPQNVSLVRDLGKEIFWIDSDSLQQIAKQYQDNVQVIFDPNTTQDAKNKATDQLLERTKLVVDDFRSLLLEVEEKKASCPAPTSSILSDTEKDHLRWECAVETLSTEKRRKAFKDMAKLFAPGTISLRSGKAADGDLLTLTLTAVGADGNPVGIPAVFEIDIKKYGTKIQWSPSLLFLHRNGVTHAEAFPPAPSNPPSANTPAPINRVNFAPSPGMTFGIAWFKRGNTNLDRFVRALGPGIGMNVTFMNFNDPSYNLATNQFVNTTGTNVQVGAGAIGSLFDNKLQFSYGWNLNVDRRRSYVAVGFGFIEIGKEVAKYVPK